MAIPEAELDTWSHQGSITQSASTYASIKRALEAPDSRYAGKHYEVFLQGSYGNDTNIYAESDVDVVIGLTMFITMTRVLCHQTNWHSLMPALLPELIPIRNIRMM